MASGQTLLVLNAAAASLPGSTYAQFVTRAGGSTPAESMIALAFEDGTDTSGEYADFWCVLPRSYGGGGITVYLHWAAASATSSDVRWGVAIRRVQDDAEDVDAAHTYDYNYVAATCATASGELDYASVAFTDGADMDSLAVGEVFVLRVFRDADNGADTMSGDAQLVSIEIKET